MLYTDLKIGTDFYSGTIANFKNIIKDFAVIDHKINQHIKKDGISHNAKQIRYGKTTVNSEMNRVKGSIKALAVGANGDGIAELSQARRDMTGDVHETLTERLDEDFDNVQNDVDYIRNNNLIINFDTYNPDKEGKEGIASALERAFKDISDNNGGVIYINTGTYLMDRRIVVPSNIKIIGYGEVKFLRGWGGGFFNLSDPDVAYKDYEGHHNITIEGITFDGNYENIDKIPSGAFNFFNLIHNENIEFRKCKFRNSISYHVLDANGVKNLNVIDCIFEGYINKSTSRFKEAIQLSEITDDSIGGKGCFDGTPCRDVTVDRCTFRKSDILDSFEVAVGNHLSRHGVFQKNIRVSNCVFEDIQQTAIRPYTWQNVQVLNNEFKNCNEGMRCSSVGYKDVSAQYPDGKPSGKPESGRRYIIDGNIFSNYKSFAINFYGQQSPNDTAFLSDVTITNNMFQRDNYDSGEAVNLSLCNYVILTGNNFNTTYRGIRHNGSQNISIFGNFMYNIKTEAIYNGKSTYINDAKTANFIFIKDNVINNTGKNAIYATDYKRFAIRENYIVSPANGDTDSVSRGGIYSVDSVDGDVSNNIIVGKKKSFAIRLSKNKNVVMTNNGGSGSINYYDSTNTIVGRYSTNSNNVITKVED